MKRACKKSWLETFLEWTLPRSEAPTSFLLWSGIFTVAAATKRRVKFPATMLGSYDIYPSLYLVFVGPPGVARKSTTAGYAERLIRSAMDGVPVVDSRYIYLGPTAGSHSKLLEIMSKLPDGAMTIISSEFGNLVSATPEGMYDVLTHLFDNPEVYEYATRMHGNERVHQPSLNLLGCTTPGWISENTGYMIRGGFASRVIFVFEQFARQRKMYYTDVDHASMEDMEARLSDDLLRIAELEGEFELESEELQLEIENWYRRHAESPQVESAEGFHARKHVHAHKVAMILSLMQSDDLVVTKAHFQSARALLDEVEKKMERGLAVVGRNPLSADLYRIYDYIGQNGPVEKSKLIMRFWHDILPSETSQILEALLLDGMIEGVREGNSDKVFFRLKN